MGLRTREDVNLTAFVTGELQNQMRRSSKAIEAKPRTGARAAETIGAISDDSGAEQRRCVFVREGFRDGMGEVFADGGEFGVAAIHVVSGELGGVAEILEA